MTEVILNGHTYSDGADPDTGMGNGGHRARFILALYDFIAEATARKGEMQGLATAAADSEAAAADAEAAAAAWALTALNAPGTSATSVTNLTLIEAAIALTVQAGKNFVAGQSVKIASAANPTLWMAGDITVYDSATGALSVTTRLKSGSGTYASWIVSLTAPTLPVVLKAGDTMTGPLSVPAGAAGTQVPQAQEVLAKAGGTMTGPIVLPGNPAAALQAAPKQYVDAVIPAQAGNQGKFLTTDGLGGLSWGSLGTVLAPLAGGNLIEKAVTYAFHANAAYTLPDITGQKAFGLLAPSNAAAVPASLTTSDGWSFTTGFVAGTLRYISPTSTDTAHGIWPAASMTPPALASFTGLGTAGTYIASCQLDVNLVVVLYKGSGNTTWAVAINTATNQAGTPAQLDTATPVATNVAIYADTASSFVAFYGAGRACAGSVSGALAITPGVAVNCDNTTDVPKQLASGLYVGPGNGGSPRPITITSVTTINVGSGVSLGASCNGARISKISATTCLIAYTSAGGGSATTRALSAVVATWNGTSLVYGAPATQASNNNQDGAIRLLQPYVDGSSWLVCVQSGTTSTTGNYSAITAAAGAAAIGAQTARANDLVPATFANRFDIYKPAQPAIRYNASTILLGHLAAGPYAVTIAGTNLAFGASGGPATTVNFLTDFAGTTFFAVGAAAFDKITVAGTVIASAWQVASVPTVISSETLTEKVVNYGGTWYSWTLPAVATALTANKWLFNTTSNTTILGGPVA